jgi:hypothetical protein
MSGFIMFLLIIGVIYIAFTYLKGPRNTDTDRNTFNMQNFNGDTRHEDLPPELSGNDETEMESDGEDVEEIGFEPDEAESSQESEAPPAPKSPAAMSRETPVAAPPQSLVTPESPASPASETKLPEASAADGVVIDTEVRIDAEMPLDNNK